MKFIAAVIILTITYFVQKMLFSKYWNRGLETDVYFNRDFVECGENAELVEIVTNRKALPLPVFHLKFSVDKSLKFLDNDNSMVTDKFHKNEVFAVMGHQRITRKHLFTATLRGVVGISDASVLVKDYFMTGSYATKAYCHDTIYVFPKKINTERFNLSFRGIYGEIEARRSIVEDSLTFRGIRPYQSFDPYRSINWKQSAKSGDLMVNMYGYTTDSRVRILLNLDNDYMIETNKLLEEAISLASSFARHFLDEGVGVSVVTNGRDGEGRVLPPVEEGAEKRHGITIDKTLTEIDGSEGKDYFLEILKKEMSSIKDEVLYLVISPYAKEDMMTLLDKLQSEGAAVHMVVPYYDEFPYVPNRSYADGWEVPLNV